MESEPQDMGASSSEDRATAAEPVVSALRDGIPSAREQCTMGVGCDQFGVCYADAHGQPEQCPHFARDLEEYGWNWLDAQYTNVTLGSHANDRAYSADEMIDAFMAGHTQGIEAQRAATTGAVHESPVAESDAPNPNPLTKEGGRG